MKLSRLHPGHFWSSESGMTSLLIFTLAYLFVVCALSDLRFGDLVADLMFSLIIVAGVLTTFKQRWVRFLVIGLAVATMALTWQQEIHPVESLAILNTVLRLIFLGFLFAVLIVQVFGAGAVTRPPDSRRHRGLPALGGDVEYALPFSGHDHPQFLPPAGGPGSRQSGGAWARF